MNVSAINCTPIKPQASFGYAQGAEEAQRVLELSKQLKDSFNKEVQQGNESSEGKITNKNPIQTTLSVLGACATMFALGKGAGKGVVAVAKKLPEGFKENVLKSGSSVKTFISNQASKFSGKETSPNFLLKSIGKALKNAKATISKNPEKSFTNATGIIAATTLVPAITTADGNKDGIADIAQNNINAYVDVFKRAEIFSDIVNALS